MIWIWENADQVHPLPSFGIYTRPEKALISFNIWWGMSLKHLAEPDIKGR